MYEFYIVNITQRIIWRFHIVICYLINNKRPLDDTLRIYKMYCLVSYFKNI